MEDILAQKAGQEERGVTSMTCGELCHLDKSQSALENTMLITLYRAMVYTTAKLISLWWQMHHIQKQMMAQVGNCRPTRLSHCKT